MIGRKTRLAQPGGPLRRQQAERGAQADLHFPADAQRRFAQRIEIAVARSRTAGHDAEAVDIVGGEFLGAAQQRIRVIKWIHGRIRLMMRGLGAEGAVFGATPGLGVDDPAGERGGGLAGGAGQPRHGQDVQRRGFGKAGKLQRLGRRQKRIGAGRDAFGDAGKQSIHGKNVLTKSDTAFAVSG